MANMAKDIVAKGLRSGQVDGTADSQLAFAERHLRDYFPHKFASTKSAPSRVDGGVSGRSGGRGKGAKTFQPRHKEAAADYVEMAFN